MDIQHVRVRFRQGGEWLDLAKRGRHTLKNLLQEWQVLPWERDRIPLIYVGERLVGVVGYYLEEAYMATYDEMGWDIKW
jgi:tRNA(Ile)-lysidine synthase